jgi:two-component system nitrogen regulation sensor histidine kinase NtrY
MKKSERAYHPDNLRRLATAFFILLALFFAISYMVEEKYALLQLEKTTQNTIHKLDNQCVESTKRVFRFLSQKNHTTWNDFSRHLSDLQTNIIVFHNQKPIFWTANDFPAEIGNEFKPGKAKITFINNAPYIVFKKVAKNYTVVSTIQLNKKLLPYGVKLLKGIQKGESRFPESIFNITIEILKQHIPPLFQNLLILFYLLSVVLATYFFIAIVKKMAEAFPDKLKENETALIILSTIIGIRVLVYFAGLPHVLNSGLWTSGHITNIKGWATPLDLLMNTLLFIIFITEWYRLEKAKSSNPKSHPAIKYILYPILILSVPIALYALSENILQNGATEIINDNFYVRATGIIDMLMFITLNFILYSWVSVFVIKWERQKAVTSIIFLSLTLTAGLFFLLPFFNHTQVIAGYLTVMALYTIIKFISYSEKPYIHSILSLLILSAITGWFLNLNRQKNLSAHQIFTANILTLKKDPYFQYQIHTKVKQILNDPKLKKILFETSDKKEQLIEKYMDSTYFRGALTSYTKQYTLCEPEEQLEVQPGNRIVNCDEFFNEMSGKVADSSKDFTLSFVNNITESIYYLARFRFETGEKKHNHVNLYIEFFTNRIPKSMGYPEKLQNNAINMPDITGYSFAYYNHDKLEYKFGDFPFPLDFGEFSTRPMKKFFTNRGYIHYILPVSKTEKLIVSRPAENLSRKMLPFSLLFLLSGIILLIFITFTYGKTIRQTFRYSFSTRLQLTIFGALLLVYGMLTLIILYYFNSNNNQTIAEHLKEKTHSVMIELQHKLSIEGNTTFTDSQLLQSNLQDISEVFFTDINLYSKEGKLIASSRPEIFTGKLQSRLINPRAYFQIEIKNNLFYIGKEKIQQQAFYSSYAQFIYNGREAGIINLPYFSQQSEIQRTYFQMLANLINLFVITGLAAMLLMIYLSRLLTKPLKLLQEKIQTVSIEKQNEKIEWNRQDEIGKLVEAYNQMVGKLQESAKLLKDSAQDKAWREMARQIAHEIRNPLTPMKLNVQYLQKIYQTEDPTFGEKFKKVSSALIDQIETLNEVVNMFSDFSRKKEKITRKTDLIQALQSSVTFFKKSEDINISMHTKVTKVQVRISQQNLLRIFNNLLKNAIQSMENKTEKRIEIFIEEFSGFVIIKLRDNGKGISRKDEEHIFQPYFTTKSKGSGLGLAIVKNLVVTNGGEITFLSKEGEGTTFIIKFPLAEE